MDCPFPAGLIAAVLAVAAPATAAKAQDAGFAAKMTVPFAFQIASGQRFAPGVYTIRMNGEQSMLIRSNTASGLAMTQLANDGQPATQGKAVFTHYGNHILLALRFGTRYSSHLTGRDRRPNGNRRLPPIIQVQQSKWPLLRQDDDTTQRTMHRYCSYDE